MRKALSSMLAVLSCMTGLWINPAHATDLTASEIKAELVGRSIVWWEHGGWNGGTLTLAPDGRAEITLEGKAPTGDAGRWALRGSELCTAWNGLRDGQTKCYSVRREGDRFVTSGGNVFQVREAGV